MAPSFDLNDAYSVETPEDNRELYRKWAQTYESEFVAPRGYVYHQGVADCLALQVSDRTKPILDVGCGTGMAGEALSERGFVTLDGIDLSPEMMERAKAKGKYRSLAECDLTQPLDIATGTYFGFVSVGVFTHGHVGPEPLDELVRIGADGAAYAIGVNADHFNETGFAQKLAGLNSMGHISAPELRKVRIYMTADDEHGEDEAIVVMFTRTMDT